LAKAKMLVEYGENVNLKLTDGIGKLSLHIAEYDRQEDIGSMNYDYSADVIAVNLINMTVLNYACNQGTSIS
jgi:ankyrin repeat protein